MVVAASVAEWVVVVVAGKVDVGNMVGCAVWSVVGGDVDWCDGSVGRGVMVPKLGSGARVPRVARVATARTVFRTVNVVSGASVVNGWLLLWPVLHSDTSTSTSTILRSTRCIMAACDSLLLRRANVQWPAHCQLLPPPHSL